MHRVGIDWADEKHDVCILYQFRMTIAYKIVPKN